MAETEKFSIPKANLQKIELIKSYQAGEISSFIDEIKDRTELNSILAPYVPPAYRKLKDNIKKYRSAQQFFVKNFKEDITEDDLIKELKQEIKMNDYIKIYLLWLTEQAPLNEDDTRKDFELLSSNRFINVVIDICKQEKYPKEQVLKAYKFNPYIDQDDNIEKEISDLTYQFSDYIEQLEKQVTKSATSNSQLELLTKENSELSKQVSLLKNDIKSFEIEYNELTINYEALKNSNENLTKEASELDNLKKRNSILENENQELSAIAQRYKNIPEPLKMKESLENKIKNLENILKQKEDEIEELKFNSEANADDIKSSIQYQNLHSNYERLSNYRIKELADEIEKDKKLQQIILSLILDNSIASKLVIEHLDLKDAVIQSGYDYYNQQMAEKQIEYNNLCRQTREKSNELGILHKQIQQSELYLKQLSKSEPVLVNNQKTSLAQTEESLPQAKVIETYYTYDTKDAPNMGVIFKNADHGFMQKFISSDFLIMDEEVFENTIGLAEHNLPICRVIVEHDWHSYKDWFGKYEQGIFHPAQTMVANYYKFVREYNEELPFGVVVFEKFNKILPEIYLEPFIDSLEKKGKLRLINPSEIRDNGEFAVIEKLPKLKYIMLTTDDENSFGIPKSLEKYKI